MTRCKFYCHSITKRLGYRYDGKSPAPITCFTYDAEFSAVISGSEENKQFFAATPGGTFSLRTLRADQFEPGKEYYLDITPAN